MGTIRKLAVVIVLVTGTVGVGLTMFGPGIGDGETAAPGTPTATPAGTATPGTTATTADGGTPTATATATRDGVVPTVQQNLLANELHNRINTYRQERFTEETVYETAFQEPLHAHARDMATHDYLGREGPDGTTLTERLSNVSNCQPETNFARYEPGSELNERAVADELVARWSENDDSERTMLTNSRSRMTVGVAQDGDGTVYVVLAAC